MEPKYNLLVSTIRTAIYNACVPRMSEMVNPEVEVSFFEKLARVPAAPGPDAVVSPLTCRESATGARTGAVELGKQDIVCVGRCGRPDGPPRGVDVRAEDRVGIHHPGGV